MSIETFIWKRAKFSHGGTLHQNQEYNDLLTYRPELRNSLPSIEYERRFQKFWIFLYWLYT
jgi:hypothetical protein